MIEPVVVSRVLDKSAHAMHNLELITCQATCSLRKLGKHFEYMQQQEVKHKGIVMTMLDVSEVCCSPGLGLAAFIAHKYKPAWRTFLPRSDKTAGPSSVN